MRSSDVARASFPLACALAIVPLQLGCLEPEPTGDLDRFGCPDGETCTPGAVQLTRSVAYRCGGMVAMEAAPSRGSTAVALGGRTTAAVSWLGWGPADVAESTFSAEFETIYDPGSAVYSGRAVALGTGRFDARSSSDTVIDYVRMPVQQADHAIVTDGVACAEDERVLLRHATVALRAAVFAGDGTPLVDLDATVRTLAGESSVTPGARSDRITFRLRFGGDGESLDTLRVVDAVDRIGVAEAPLDRLRRAPLALTRVVTRLCFRAFSGAASVLGLRVVSTRSSDERLEVAADGACVLLTNREAFVRDAPQFDAVVTVAMGGRSIEVPVRAVTNPSLF